MSKLVHSIAPLALSLGLITALAGAPPAGSEVAAQRSTAQQPGQAVAGWQRVFTDGFGSAKASRGKWSNTAPSPLPLKKCWSFTKVSGQKVVVIKSRKPWEVAGNVSCRMATGEVFGAGATTYKFSARVKFHEKQGTLSSFWVTGPGPNEIDVIENAGKKSGKAKCVLAGTDNDISKDNESGSRFYGLMHNVYHAYEPTIIGHRACVTKASAYPRYDGRFHTVTATWRPGTSVVFEVDGRRSAKYPATWSRTDPVVALLTNKSRKPNDVGFVVDWVKVWKKV